MSKACLARLQEFPAAIDASTATMNEDAARGVLRAGFRTCDGGGPARQACVPREPEASGLTTSIAEKRPRAPQAFCGRLGELERAAGNRPARVGTPPWSVQPAPSCGAAGRATNDAGVLEI
jgi:hypothetical protein